MDEKASPAPAGTHGVAPGARHALTLLVLINLFNYIDRQVLAAVEPSIREEFFSDPEAINGNPTLRVLSNVFNTVFGGAEEDGNANAKALMGLLSTAFLLTYMVMAPVFGWLANRMRRWVIVGVGVTIWSLASGGSGLATVYLMLLLTRCFVGIGEAAYGPVAPDMISDLYPVQRRGSVLAFFYAAIPFGGALGYALGSGLEHFAGSLNFSSPWRVPFYSVVIPGLALGVWCFLMPEPKRGQLDLGTPGATPEPRRSRGADYLILLRTPSYVLNTLGMTAMTFAIGGMAWWMPGYLKDLKVEKLWGFIPPTTLFGGITALTGLLATLAGGALADRLRPRFSGSYFLVSGVALLLSFPMLLLMIHLPFPLAWIPLALSVFFLFFNTGPTNTILANVTHPLLRAPGFALNILVIHLFGDAISPPIMGLIAGHKGWNAAFIFVSCVLLVGGLLWLWGMRYLARDTELAPRRLDAAK
jgi:MFS family permease